MSEREFVVINEEAARTAQNMMSFNEYQLGSRTKEYQEDVNEVYDLAEEVVARRGIPEKSLETGNQICKEPGKIFQRGGKNRLHVSVCYDLWSRKLSGKEERETGQSLG